MKRSQQILTLLLCVFAAGAIVVACSKSTGYSTGTNTGGSGSGNAVSIANFAFSVVTLNVAKGTEVTWTNNDATTHTVTADDGSFDSGNIPSGGTFKHTFNTAGTIKYHCAIHPMMMASVVVK